MTEPLADTRLAPTRTVNEVAMIDDEPPDDENPQRPWPKHDRASSVREALFVSDAEIYRRLGVGPRTGRTAILLMEKSGRFPTKDPVFGNKRYWPAVAKAIDDRYSASPYTSRIYNPVTDGPETSPTRRPILGPGAPEQDRARYGYTDGNGNFRKIVAGLRARQVRVTAPDGRKWTEDAKPTDPASWQRKRPFKPRKPPATE